ANRYSIARTYTATDVCGNASSATQTITVDDQTAPVITSIPANTTVSCASAVPAFNHNGVVATDNCIGTVTITHADVVTPGSCANRYSIARTYTATDVCGNASSATQTITVDDQTAPVITSIPANTTVSSASAVPAFNHNAVVATDNCIETVTITHADVVTPGSCANRYAIARTYTATDACGNASSATQTITVNDQTAPVITSIPANTTVSCTSAVPGFNDNTVVATDNCLGTVTITHADVVTPGSCANRYSIARTYTATDACGNASSATQTITVNDQTAPAITSIPANTSVSCASAVPEFNDNAVVATDNCIGTVTITHADVVTPGSCANRYSIARTYTVTDACGNTSSATQTIIVNDQTAPVITSVPANTSVSCASAVPGFNDNAVVATDNCIGTVTITHADVVTPGSCANRYSIARTYTATDAC
ncbi:gliding motility-associated C-terminal domain-containing protein, partial [Flavobacterium sp. LB3P45]